MSTEPAEEYVIEHAIKDLIGYEYNSVRKILEIIDVNAQGICFIINQSGKLLGSVTDGDVRRALLKGFELDTPVGKIMRLSFVSLPMSTPVEEIQAMLSSTIRFIPLVDDNARLVDYASWNRMHRIPVMEPTLNGNEMAYVIDCIKTGWISSQGNYVREFEALLADYCSMPYALAVSNGTVALHLALVALGVSKGDQVIVPDITFAACINAVIHTGATPVLVDVSRDTWSLSPVAVEKAITSRTKAIMPVHLYGHPCHMDELLSIAKEHNLFVVEDCAEALGSTYKGRPVGSLGDVSTFSFFGNKTITTGEGGMLLIRDKQVYERAHALRDHGMSKEKKYWHDVVGYNYRMTNLQGAIGVAQMERLNEFVEAKRKTARYYNHGLSGLNEIITPPEEAWARNSFWLYTILLSEKAGILRDNLINELLTNGIESRPTFYPLHQMSIYKQYSDDNTTFPIADYVSANGISLPSSANLSEKELDSIIDTVVKFVLKVRQTNLVEA